MWNGTRRFLPTFPLGGYLGCDLFVNLIKECLELLRRIQSDEVAEVGGVETFLCGGAQPLEFGFVFQFALLIVFQIALLKEAKALAHNLASIAEATGSNSGFDPLGVHGAGYCDA